MELLKSTTENKKLKVEHYHKYLSDVRGVKAEKTTEALPGGAVLQDNAESQATENTPLFT